MLTATELRFEEIWRGQVWRSHTFPKLTPVKHIAERLHCTEKPLWKALVHGETKHHQWTITAA